MLFEIGIHANHYNPSLAVFLGGNPIFFSEEERFTRVKHAFGCFPTECLRFAADKYGIDAHNCESVSFAWDTSKYDGFIVSDHYKSIRARYDLDRNSLAWQARNLDSYRTEKVSEYIEREFIKSVGWAPSCKNKGFDHHLIHASMAVRDSPFHECLVLTIDGSGETESTVLWTFKDERLEKISRTKVPHSLGWWFSAYTEYLGFQANSGEYKLMGLAAYGRPSEKLNAVVQESLVTNSDNLFEVDPNLVSFGNHSFSSRFTDLLVDRLSRPPRRSGEEITQWHADLAHCVQGHLERVVKVIVKNAIEESSLDKISISGGVAHNVKLAGSILSIPGVADVFAHPLAGDLGTSYGSAAFAHCPDIRKKSSFSLSSLYLGPEYPRSECVRELEQLGIDFDLLDDLPAKIAALLEDGNIVGWFQGRMEAGPRALGNRSILADPNSLEIRDRVNHIKNREIWRPLCPVVLDYRASDYFPLTSSDPYMSLARPTTALGRESLSGCTHKDFTTRPQVIREQDNPLLYNVVQCFEARCGVGALLNTSFNVAGEPIVLTPKDAIKCFLESGLDYLCMQNVLVRSPERS